MKEEIYDENNGYDTSKKFLSRMSIVGVFFTVICISILLFFHYYPLSHVNYSPLLPNQSKESLPSPTLQASNPDFIEQCPVQKAGNPMVRQVTRIRDGTVGVLAGTINHIVYTAATKTAVFDVISPRGDQHHIFTITDTQGLVTEGASLSPRTLADLKYGQGVELSFQCDQYTRYHFTLTEITLLQQR